MQKLLLSATLVLVMSTSTTFAYSVPIKDVPLFIGNATVDFFSGDVTCMLNIQSKAEFTEG